MQIGEQCAREVIKALPTKRLDSRAARESRRSHSTAHYFQLALAISFAIEVPLVLAFHPTTLIYGIDIGIPFPSTLKLLAQLLWRSVVDVGFADWVELYLSPGNLGPKQFSRASKQGAGPFGLAMEFLRPTGALLLGVAAVGTPSIFGVLAVNYKFS